MTGSSGILGHMTTDVLTITRGTDVIRVGAGDLVSNVEVARILGVTRQRAQAMDVNPPPGYPPAVVRTAHGALRLRADVEAWAKLPRSRGGRPRKVTQG